MSKLDDFLGPLHQGVWEVIVLKGDLTEPLDEGWEKSKVNLPSPETIASYRKGRYHCHETKTDYRVHLDLYDPKAHPLMHLVDDAPLILLLGGTLESMWVNAKNVKKMDPKELLKEQKLAWWLLLLAGVSLLVLGGLVMLTSIDQSQWILKIFALFVVPMFIIALALIILFQGARVKPSNPSAKKNILLGLALVGIGVLSYIFPGLLVLLLIGFLVIWPLSSAVVSLKRTSKGRISTPDGFGKRIVIAVLSLLLAGLFFINPAGVAGLIIFVVATIIVFMGGLFVLRGLGVRSALKSLPFEEGLNALVTDVKGNA